MYPRVLAYGPFEGSILGTDDKRYTTWLSQGTSPWRYYRTESFAQKALEASRMSVVTHRVMGWSISICDMYRTCLMTGMPTQISVGTVQTLLLALAPQLKPFIAYFPDDLSALIMCLI